MPQYEVSLVMKVEAKNKEEAETKFWDAIDAGTLDDEAFVEKQK